MSEYTAERTKQSGDVTVTFRASAPTMDEALEMLDRIDDDGSCSSDATNTGTRVIGTVNSMTGPDWSGFLAPSPYDLEDSKLCSCGPFQACHLCGGNP